MPPQLYTPPNCQPLDQVQQAQIRLGLQGYPGVGKTWSALTFPNPIVANFDRGLGAHIGNSNITEAPFYNPAFVDKIYPRSGSTCPPNRRDALLKWLATEATKLSPEQTLIVDGLTGLNNAFESEYNVAPELSNGKVDKFAIWRQKLEYFGEVCEQFKALPCHVVFICHETPDRNDKGDLNGMVRPLMSGQFADQLASHFTDFFRCHAHAAPTKETETKAMEFYKLTSTEFQEWKKKMPAQTWYIWQTMADEISKCKTSSLVNAPKYILADYQSFGQYKRKLIS